MGLFDIFSGGDARDAANDRSQGLYNAWSNATSNVGSGLKSANSYYDRALLPFQALSGAGTAGINSYSDALGLNGAAGNARATAAFQNNPGYKTQLTYGLQGIDRGAAARGMLSSGNTAMAEQKYGNDLASQGWQSYLNSFSPFFNLAGQGAQGQGTILGTQAGTNYDAGKTDAGYDWNYYTGVGDANASADLANYTASQNAFSALMGGLGLGGKLLGYSGGGAGAGAAGAAGGADPMASMSLFSTLAGLSDRRLKKDIKPVGKLPDGLTVYEYRYKGANGGPLQRGVMAQEVEKKDPAAVIDIGGMKVVNYGRVIKRSFDLLDGRKAA